MASVKSTQWGYSFPTTPPQTELKPSDLSGKVRAAYCSYTIPVGDLTAGDILNLFKLPKGARVISLEACVPASFVVSSATVGYGTVDAAGTITAVDADRWGAAIDLSSVGRKQFLTVAADMEYVVLNATDNPTLQAYSEVAVYMTFTTGAAAAGKVISVLCQYVID